MRALVMLSEINSERVPGLLRFLLSTLLAPMSCLVASDRSVRIDRELNQYCWALEDVLAVLRSREDCEIIYDRPLEVSELQRSTRENTRTVGVA